MAMHVQIKKHTFVNIHFCNLLRNPIDENVVHNRMRKLNVANSVLNFNTKNAFTKGVILQQICTKNTLK